MQRRGVPPPLPPHVAEKVRTQCNILSLHMRPTVLAKNWCLVGCPKVPCTRWLLSVVLWHGGDSPLQDDEVAEWLRRWTANPMCSARVGSNPILVDIFYQSFDWNAEGTNPNLLNSLTDWRMGIQKLPKRVSVTGNWTRATWVRARYPNH